MPSSRPFLVLVAAALATSAMSPVRAERADREKPVNVESDRMTADDRNRVSVFEGKVVVTQGTMILRADRVTIREDKDGQKYATAIGKPATFRQKRDNVDEWIDGEAERIEYDGRIELVELFVSARLTRDKDEVRGNYISYDQKTEFFQVQPGKETKPAADGGGRVRAVLQPKQKPAPAPAAPGPALKPAETLSNPR